MARQPRNEWQCGACKLTFQAPRDLDDHVNSYQSRSSAIHARMRDLTLELQDLVLKLQRASEHRGLGSTPDQQQMDDTEPQKQMTLSCPHLACKDHQTYTEMRSLQRHFLNHSGAVTCPGCRTRFCNARRFDTHSCVRNDHPSRKAKSLQTQLRQTARAELAKLMPSGGANIGLGATISKEPSEYRETLQPVVTTVSSTSEDATTAGKAVVGHDHMAAPISSDILSLTLDAADTSQYPGGALLLQNAVDWSYPNLTPSLIFSPLTPNLLDDTLSQALG